MKLISANIEDLRSLYIAHLKKALDMERSITESLPVLMEKASDPDLISAMETHLSETRNHAEKVESLLALNGAEVETETCKAFKGLDTEASDTMKDVTDASIRDIALIGALQQVEHHEIAVYGTIRRWANVLGLTQDVAVLKGIEQEEGNADKILTSIAESINYQAAA